MKEDEKRSVINETIDRYIGHAGFSRYVNCLRASGKAEDSKEKLSVMTTFYPMYDFTKAIVGDEGEVELLIPAGTDSHDYEPSAKDMAKIQDTDIFVYNDENMETWVPAIQKHYKKAMSIR